RSAGVPAAEVAHPPAEAGYRAHLALCREQLCRQAAIAAGVKHIVAGERCVDPWKSTLHLTIDRALAKRTQRIVTNSSGVQEFYVNRGLPAEKFTIIPNGIR